MSGFDKDAAMPLLPKSKLPAALLGRAEETLEVLETFEHLYQRIDSSLLPPRVKIMPYTDDAEYFHLRDNTSPWGKVVLPGRDFSYGEIFEHERGQFKGLLPSAERDAILELVARNEMTTHLQQIVPARLRIYTDWVKRDLGDILIKRAAIGSAASLFEDLYQVYRAGYFSFGWTGKWPDDVHFLVFPARESTAGKVGKLFSKIPNLPQMLRENELTREVLDVFDHLFEKVDATLLPERAVIKPYTDDTEGSNLRDNTPPWEETGLPDDENLTYFEIFGSEIAAINIALNSGIRSQIASALSPDVSDRLSAVLPTRMYNFCYWIVGELISILEKRLVHGRSPSLLEDLFQVYRAGFFSFGWTGHYPDDVKFMVFPSWEEDPALPGPPARHEYPELSAWLAQDLPAPPARPPGKPHIYTFAQVQSNGQWNGQFAIRQPLSDWIGPELCAIPDTMQKKLLESQSGFEQEFQLKGSDPLLFRWKQTASTSGIATIAHASELLWVSAILTGLSMEDDQTAINAMDALLKNRQPSLRASGMANRPTVVSTMFKNVPNGEGNCRLLTFGFADVYFWMVEAYRPGPR